MARNEEKHYSKLNRILLEKQREDERLRNPKRPRLTELHTAEEIKMWLPSIKRDLDFNLKQSQVLCYPERKIEEFRSQIMCLEKEYKAFVRKLHTINPKNPEVPWTDRPYSNRKRKAEIVTSETKNKQPTGSADVTSTKNTERLSLPILQSKFEQQYTSDTNTEQEISDSIATEVKSWCTTKDSSDNSAEIFTDINKAMLDTPLVFGQTTTNANLLGLDYDSSDSDDT